MSGLVTCDKIVKALAEGLENATEIEKEGICESLACCEEETKTPGEIVCEAFDEITEVDEAPENGKVVFQTETGECVVAELPEPPASKASGEIVCEAFDEITEVDEAPENGKVVFQTETGDCVVAELPEPPASKASGVIVCEAFDEITEVDEAPEGAKVVVRDEDGNCFVSPAPKGGGDGGDICESFDTLPELAGFGTSPRIIISNEEGCGIVTVPAKGIFTDIRAEANVSQGTLIEGGVSTVRFTARNVSQVPTGPVRLIATFPSTDPTDPEFTSEAPTFTNASGATITQVSPGVFDIDELGAGEVVTANYLTTFGVQGSYIFSTTVEIQAANAIDFDSADDYATTSVSVRYREEPSPQPEICPQMDVRVTGGGLTDAPVSLRSDIGSILPTGSSTSYPENLVFVPLVDGKASLTISTAVPVTMLPYVGPNTNAEIRTTLIVGGTPYIGFSDANSTFSNNPQTFPPSPYIQISSNPDNTQFTLEADTDPDRGVMVRIAVRPNESCIWQQFAIYFGREVPSSTLSFSGGSPNFVITDGYLPNSTPRPTVLVGGIPALAGGVSNVGSGSPINLVESAIIRPNSGTAYSFKVTSQGPVNLGTTSATGNISIDVISNTEWDITIEPTASSNDDVTIGRLRFEFND